MIVKTGVDLIEIERIRQSCERHGDHFLQRIYTDRELEQVAGDFAALATRFAAKEAVAKALGTGIGAVNWKEIEIIRKSTNEPVVILHGRAKAIAVEIGIQTWSLSLSHSRTQAVAVFVGIGLEAMGL